MNCDDVIKALQVFCEEDNDMLLTKSAAKGVLNLINRQKAEIEALINGQETLGKRVKKQKEEIDNLTNIIQARNRENERLTLENLQLIASIKKLEFKAYKEFAERLKNSPSVINCESEWLCLDIDNLLTELTGK